MKKILLIVVCLCIFFPHFNFAENIKRQSSTYSKLVSQKQFPNIFRPFGSFFKRLFRKKQIIGERRSMIGVESVRLSQNQLQIVYATYSSKEVKGCASNKQSVEILTKTNEDSEVFTYRYTVSAGKIIGEGSRVIWDLSNVKAGNYTIFVEAADACGFCGTSVTTEICLIE
jgi:hypothetical protein